MRVALPISLLVLGAAAGAYWYFGHRNKKQSDDDFFDENSNNIDDVVADETVLDDLPPISPRRLKAELETIGLRFFCFFFFSEKDFLNSRRRKSETSGRSTRI